ncbi:hypothetical protein RF11_01231 [Thelohanellus kitauei]|uniref:Uncharacterized protein n=1 Tax=Thelohanellus kitauei TaxID=669202 RepID=A0A0C2N3B2_THEKT|nr:hypothetical protein RF11_01231 [Thelohanellus kitauei]
MDLEGCQISYGYLHSFRKRRLETPGFDLANVRLFLPTNQRDKASMLLYMMCHIKYKIFTKRYILRPERVNASPCKSYPANLSSLIPISRFIHASQISLNLRPED